MIKEIFIFYVKFFFKKNLINHCTRDGINSGIFFIRMSFITFSYHNIFIQFI